MQNLSKEIAEIARYVLKNIAASKRLPTPLIYKNEFIDAARKLKKERILKYIFEDEKTLEQQFAMILSEARGVLSSLQLSISFFEEENRENMATLSRSIDTIKEYALRSPHENGLQKLLGEALKIRSTNQQLMESLNETKKDLFEKEEKIKDLEYRSQLDPLTQLLNRRSWEKHLEKEFKRSKRYGNVFSIIMIDIDYFKRFNDFYGQQVGDAILGRFGSLLKDNVRSTDTVFRYGGEKFAILLPETPLERAEIVATHIHKTINSSLFTYDRKNLELNVTASLGVTDSQGKATPDDIVEAADKALYLSKLAGRNCVKTEKMQS